MTSAVVAEPGVAELVLEGSGFPIAPEGGEASVHFGWDAPAEPRADVVWVAAPATEIAGRRVIAPAGEHAWRRAPWPAADALFDLEPAPGAVLVVGDGAGPDVAEELADRPVDVIAAPRLDLAQLSRAGVVVLAGEAGAPLPAEAPAVLAAGRVLLTTGRSPAFGFRPGIDHCRGEGAEELADLATSAMRHWGAFRSVRVHARIAAERHRASRVLADLMVDLELGL